MREAKFPKGVPMTVDEVAAVVGPEFKEMNENPPPEVVKVREEMQSKAKSASNRVRLSWGHHPKFGLEAKEAWAQLRAGVATNENRLAADQHHTREAATGLYGYTKTVQRTCEGSVRKLSRQALRIAKRAFAKDEQVVAFLQAHAKRGKSASAKVLLAAMREIGPKVASQMYGGRIKDAGKTEYGLYGFKARTADLGLEACKDLRAHAGRVAADLHRRRADHYDPITSFLKDHSKQGRCVYSRMLLACYPDSTIRLASERPPASVRDWLTWDED